MESPSAFPSPAGSALPPPPAPTPAVTGAANAKAGQRAADSSEEFIDVPQAEIDRLKAKAEAESANAPKAGHGSGGAQVAASSYAADWWYQYTTQGATQATYKGVNTWRVAGDSWFFSDLSNEPFVQWGKACLLMQHDGNLVLYDERGIHNPAYARWDSGTWGHPGAYARFQPDGNFVVYSASGAVIRKRLPSNTSGGSGRNLHVQADGNMVIYAPTWNPIWATNTQH
ncbi:hypothetical protein COUCH_15195 [Couchioplanes caeruleus]|uniref:hypothetical protein n=1 Tax=Couchioplanes caeruleus TaxID=56438 RepID=UPI0020BF1B80|nr:hypothetical protein [Couchioplanes caeruleus]UQU67529.1 hypothetical protein COUCH_15195 [Couchioplanes caeruleus]